MQVGVHESETPYSRYRDAPVYEGEGGLVVWGWKDAPIPPQPDDTIHTVTAKDAHRLTLISHAHYGTVALWWVIARRNNLFNPRMVPAGATLLIPSLATINRLVLGRR